METSQKRAHQQKTSVAVLDVRCVDDRLQQQPLVIHQDMPLLSLDLLAGVIARRIDLPPFFRAFYALAVDDGGCRAGLLAGELPTLDIERVVDAIERAVIVPASEIIVPGWRSRLFNKALDGLSNRLSPDLRRS